MMQAVEMKRLGSYLIEAGLITPAQVDVALSDQSFSEDMRIGEILVMRGWIKQQTLDFLITKIIEPEQAVAREQTLEDHLIRRYQPRPADTATVIQPIAQPINQSRLSDPATPPIGQTSGGQTSIAQARSLDGNRVIEILRPKTDYSASANLPNGSPTEPGQVNDRKPLASVPDDDDMNWVG